MINGKKQFKDQLAGTKLMLKVRRRGNTYTQLKKNYLLKIFIFKIKDQNYEN